MAKAGSSSHSPFLLAGSYGQVSSLHTSSRPLAQPLLVLAIRPGVPVWPGATGNVGFVYQLSCPTVSPSLSPTLTHVGMGEQLLRAATNENEAEAKRRTTE